MCKRAVWMVLAATVGFAPISAAQAPAMRRVEFDEAVRVALEHNPTVASAATAIAQAEALLLQSRAALMPLVSASVTSVTADAARGIEETTTQPRSQVAFGVAATLPLLAATRRAEVDHARDEIIVATRSSEDVRRQVAVATGQAYLGVVATRRQVDIAQRALENADSHLDDAQKRLAAGVGSRLNELRAAQEASRDRSLLENATLGLRRAQEALGVLLGENSPIDVGADPVFEIPPVPADEGWMENRPDLLRDAAVIRSTERVVKDAWKVWLPSMTMSFEPRLVGPAGLFQPTRSYQLVFSVSQRIFDQGQRAVTAQDKVALDRALFARTTTEIAARSEVRFARESVESYGRAAESARLAADQANEVLRITTQAFEAGATSNIEVIDAQRSARNFELASAIADDNARTAQLDLLAALGLFPK